MTLQGTVIDGVVVLDQGARLADGTRVEVVVPIAAGQQQPAETAAEPKSTLAFLMKYAGCMPDLPPDFAAQHDHYIHGTPKP